MLALENALDPAIAGRSTSEDSVNEITSFGAQSWLITPAAYAVHEAEPANRLAAQRIPGQSLDTTHIEKYCDPPP
jgi:hypothetical protein